MDEEIELSLNTVITLFMSLKSAVDYATENEFDDNDVIDADYQEF